MSGKSRRCLFIVIGICAVFWSAAPVLADDLFQSAPGPVAPKPKPRPHAPAPEAAPAPAGPQAGTPAVSSAPLAHPPGAFDGAYTGTVTMAMASTTGGHHRNCLAGAVVKMIIASSTVLIQQGGRPDGGTANYRGTVDAGGAVSASATYADGTVHTVSGKMSQARFAGQIQRSNCTFSVDLVKG